VDVAAAAGRRELITTMPRALVAVCSAAAARHMMSLLLLLHARLVLAVHPATSPADDTSPWLTASQAGATGRRGG